MIARTLRTILVIPLTVVLLCSSLSAQSVENVALALKKKGGAIRKSAGIATEVEPVEVGMWFTDYDSLKTEDMSYLAILFTDDKSMIKMKSNSSLVIRGEQSAVTTIRQIKLDNGTIHTKISGSQEGTYEILTPVSVASVKGTEFWTISDPSGTDTFIGLDGIVEVTNLTSGQTLQLQPGSSITSTWTGLMNSFLTDLTTIPIDPELEEQPEEGKGVEPKEGEKQKEEKPEEKPAEEAPIDGGQASPAPSGGGGTGMAMSVGAVTLDGETYSQISLRPEFGFGPLGVGLDLNLYFDADGNMRNEDWDNPQDIIDKIYYVRFHEPGDPFFIRVGALDGVTLGQGLIMDNYSNAIEYPQVRRVGLLGHKTFGKFRIQGLIGSFRELNEPGLLGARGTFKVIGPLQIGATFIMDGNQYAGLPDEDDDGVPNQVDDFPENKNLSVDSDGDGIADDLDADVDGDGYTDNSQIPGILDNDPDGISPLKVVPNLKGQKNSAIAYGVDASYPIIEGGFFGLTIYGEAATIQDYGTGFAVPGIRSHIGPASLRVELRRFGNKFIGNYFNRTYEIERASIVTNPDATIDVITREQALLESVEDPLVGVFGSAGLNLLDIVVFSAGFQMMKPEDSAKDDLQSLYGELTLNPSFIPKINRAQAFYQQTNVADVFAFDATPSTMLGYVIGYELSPGVSLLLRYIETYRDLNGNGVIDGADETIVITGIETEFTF